MSEDRTQINEAVAFLSDHFPSVLGDLRSETGHLEALLKPSQVMGLRDRQRDSDGALGKTRKSPQKGNSLPPELREEALVIQRTMPLIAERCAGAVERLRKHRRRRIQFGFWSDVATTVSGSAVIAVLAKGTTNLAYIPATISLLGTLSSLLSRYYALGFGSGMRSDIDRILRRLSEVDFDARRVVDQLDLLLRFSSDGDIIRKLVNKGNALAREVNVDLDLYIR